MWAAHLCRLNSYPLRARRITWIKTKREGVYVKSGRSGALGLSCKASKCSDARTGDLGVLITHETTSMLIGDAGSTHPG